MAKTVKVLRAAAKEARAAWSWYRARDLDAADCFLAEYDRTLTHIAEAPGRCPVHTEGTRRSNLRRFPYSVIFRERPEVIEVVAVMHQRRSPGYWQER